MKYAQLHINVNKNMSGNEFADRTVEFPRESNLDLLY